MRQSRYYFTTRDLFLMAALAALGGITSTYINALGDLVQSVTGFAGATQWAAGYHVLWVVLAAGLVRKAGSGTLTGILKGAVELLTGNTHGLLVVLVDIVAGLLVDLGMAPFQYRQKPLPYLLSGGLAAASNIFVFQLFASLPADILAYGAILILAGVAFLSGALLAGALGYLLTSALQRAGVVKDQPPPPISRKMAPLMLGIGLLLVIPLTIYLKGALKGPSSVQVGGAVSMPYQFPGKHGDITQITAEAEFRGANSRYRGYPLLEIIRRAEPKAGADMVLLRAADGYTFFLSMQELRENTSILLAPQVGKEGDGSYDIVGPISSKAWVRSVTELLVIAPNLLPVSGALSAPTTCDPSDWQDEMDSIVLQLGDQSQKAQGAPLGKLLDSMGVQAGAQRVVLIGAQDNTSLPIDEVLADDHIRLFTVFIGEQVSYAVADLTGKLYLWPVTRIEVE